MKTTLITSIRMKALRQAVSLRSALLTTLLLASLAALPAAADDASVRQQLDSLRAAIDDLAVSFPDRFCAEEFRARWQELNRAPGRQRASEIERLKVDALVAGNPLLSPGKLLFVKRHTYTPGWYYAEFMRATKFGGGLCVLSLPDGKVTDLLPQLSGGITDRYDLSFDGQRVVFGYKAAPDKGFRLYEANVDGTGLRQLTFDPPDEAQRVARFHKPKSPYYHTTDDFHPCYLPDGGIAFASGAASAACSAMWQTISR